ncbi:hypothetical protein [Aquimarina sediminis]|uniref:hypothetical protein n=1 Tax=Aquimarina sediminis TaxID=2070536 RepID=UPI000FFEBE6E|nr:hypothetical protein [Aquimarina sediminis]
MKVTSLVLVTMFTGGIIVLETKKEKGDSFESFNERNQKLTILEQELDREICEFLYSNESGNEISFENTFSVKKEEIIEPNDIVDIEEEEEIVLDVEVKSYMPKGFNKYSS